MQNTFETTIDRSDEFDQTKKHTLDLATAEVPTADQPKGIEAVFASGRSLSPSILEFRIQELKKELRAERQRHEETMRRLLTANDRIAGFERLSRTLSEAVDASAANLRAIANAAMLDAFDPIDRTPAETPIEAPEVTEQNQTLYGTDAVDMMAL